MALVDQRPVEAADRAVLGHWEGVLLMGAGNRSAIGTLVERSTRHVILVHLAQSRAADAVRDALVDVVAGLPPDLRRSLTWDQGKEMSAATETSRPRPACPSSSASGRARGSVG